MTNPNNQKADAFIRQHVGAVAPLLKKSNLASWEAAVTGSEAALDESAASRAAVKRVYSRKSDLETVTALLNEGVDDPVAHRQLDLLQMAYTVNQLPSETIDDLTRRESELEGIFYNFRAVVDGVEASNNELKEMLRSEMDSEQRRRIWEASKKIGPEIAPRLRELVRRRNEAARALGFRDYYQMELAHQEIDEDELFDLLGDFRERSEEPFRELRKEVDRSLAERHGIEPDEVRPWHWDDFFAQEAPAIGLVDLDPIFRDRDLEGIARSYFGRIGLPVEEILARSDLYEREGKDQHAFCTDIDREGDVRTLCNLRPDERWMGTLLHELGHAVYDVYLPHSLPFLIRTPAHTLSTEAIAMFFGRLPRDPEWLREELDVQLNPDQAAAVNEQQRLAMLVSARWILVMVYFERALYADPDREDLDGLWWDLVEEIQLIQRPDGRDEPDWATKIHFALAPVYYHNYLLGELMASQLTLAMRSQGPGGTEIGQYLSDSIFAHGARHPWNDLLRIATGEALSSRAFVEQFVGEPMTGG